MYSVEVSSTVRQSRPEHFTSRTAHEPGEHVLVLVLAGKTQLAADYLLTSILPGNLADTVGDIIRRLNLRFILSEPQPTESAEEEIRKIHLRQRAYEVLTEIALSLCGAEWRRTGFSKREANEVIESIICTLDRWEALEKHEGAMVTVAQAIVSKYIQDMSKVAGGDGMVAKTADKIKKELDEARFASSFVLASKRAIQSNIYFKMTAKKMCKFGNDYAIGLRWLRHLGFVQVSTNPVLAASAYNDDPELWESFREAAVEHQEWFDEPDKYGDEIAMQATMVALWPNLETFRPIAFQSQFHDGMVSYQLNPRVAASLAASTADALKVYAGAEDFLKVYDAFLTNGLDGINCAGRPNIVFKVAAGYPAAVDITTALNGMGIGTNNTVTYSVTQEAVLILAAMRGMAEAMNSGIHPTQVYETNMGGRLESHLREVEAEKQMLKALTKAQDKEILLNKLANGLGATAEVEINRPFEEKVRAVCGFKYLKKLTHPAFIEAIVFATVSGKPKSEVIAFLTSLENDIGAAGTFVAKRVYWLFFSSENKSKWLKYLQREFGLSPVGAKELMDKIDVLPASKRKPEDTLLTLAERNMTNTEFPNHQHAVTLACGQPDFRLDNYVNAVTKEPDNIVLQRLLQLVDFRKAYEMTPELRETFEKAGIGGEFGNGGLKTGDWSSFGPVVKTMNEFGAAYETFKKKAISIVRETKR